MESLIYQNVSLEIPSDICQDISLLFDILSPDTWNNHLTDENRESLMNYLPTFPEDDFEEKSRTLEMFFMDETFRFNTPMRLFHDWLCKGFFNPDISKTRAIHRKILYKEYKYKQRQYYHSLIEDVLLCRRKILDLAASLPPDEVTHLLHPKFVSKRSQSNCHIDYKTKKRYFRELARIRQEAGCGSDLSDDDENYPEGPGVSLNKRQKRHLGSMDGVLPSDLIPVHSTHSSENASQDLELHILPSCSPIDLSEDNFKAMLNSHRLHRKKRQRSAYLDTRGIVLDEVVSRSQCQNKRFVQTPLTSAVVVVDQGKKQLKRQTSILNPLPLQSNTNQFSLKKAAASVASNSSSSASDLDSDTENISNDFQENAISNRGSQSSAKGDFPSGSASLQNTRISLAPEITQETHICFFSLIRDIISSNPDQRMTQQQLESSVSLWQEDAVTPLNEWFNLLSSWVECLPSAINFLCGNFSDVQPADFVPYIEYKKVLKVYQWIGAGRDSCSKLEPLNQFWIDCRVSISNRWPGTETDADGTVSSDVALSWSVKDSKGVSIKKETIQVEMKAETVEYRLHANDEFGSSVKGVFMPGKVNKADLETKILVKDRPAHITILFLVKEALSQLRNGFGSLSEIFDLVKNSHFVENLNPLREAELKSVVNDALTQLVQDKYPFIKYDANKKIWISLKLIPRTEMKVAPSVVATKSRSLGGPRKSAKKTKEAFKAPPNVTLEPPPKVVHSETPASHTGNTGKDANAKIGILTNSPALFSTKLVGAASKVLLQRGKVVHAVPGSVATTGAKSVIIPGAQQIVSLDELAQSVKSSGLTQASVTNVKPVTSGNLIQLAGTQSNLVGSLQKVTLVSAQGGTHRMLVASPQHAKAKHIVQSVQSVPSTRSALTLSTMAVSTALPASSVIQSSSIVSTSQAKMIAVSPQQQKTMTQGKKAVVTSSGLRLLPQGTYSSTLTTLPTTSGTGSVISLGGKQVLLSAKSLVQAPQGPLQQVILASDATSSAGLNKASGAAVVVASGTNRQQIVLPAAALQGSQLKTFHTFKVIPASPSASVQGKPILARFVSPAVLKSAAQAKGKPQPQDPKRV